MTIHKLTAGNGWRYYWVETASHDETRSLRSSLTDYYTASNNPPGTWVGRGSETMGITGAVHEHQMERLFGLGRHPDSGAKLGRDYYLYRSAEERIAARLAAEPEADIARRTAIRAEEMAKRGREAVAGYDLTFAPVKSISVLWGVAGEDVRATIEACHEAAWRDALGWIEGTAIYSRKGRDGIARVAVDGVCAAAFGHRTSRTGDPHLHTHVVVSNKVRTTDGQWLTLDGTLLYQAAVAASERYNSCVEALVADRLGVDFVDETGRGIREIDGIPQALLRRFAARRLQVEARFGELLTEYRREHGRDPSHETEYRLHQRATLETRPAKKDGTTAASEREEWRDTVEHVTGDDPDALVARVTGTGCRRTAIADTAGLVADAARETLAGIQERRAQWTVLHLRAEAERVVRRHDQPAAHHPDLVDHVIDTVLADPHVVTLTSASLVDEPAELRLPNGDPIWRPAITYRYTTTTILDAEAALVTAANTTGAPTIDDRTRIQVLTQLAEEGHHLAADQAAAVATLSRSGRRIDLLIAPAGAGKSHAMRAMATIWTASTGRVIGLAPTARAARNLADAAGLTDIGTEAFTIDKWLTDTAHGRRSLHAGDLVIVDEAGMASTPHLDTLRRQVDVAGAKLLLVGDHRQLAAVGAGGALRHLYHEAEPVELTSLWRFTDPWEANATVRLRDGDSTVIDEYLARNRVRSGTVSELTEDLYYKWRKDTTAGQASIMLAVSNRTVAQLNNQARRHRIATGDVDPDGIILADGTTAGAGDTIVTRRNRPDLRILGGRDWVHNGDLWTIEHTHDDGTLTVTHLTHGARLHLPADYVTNHVALGYASTIARAQGITVDTARVLVDNPAMDRANLYVAMSRGRTLNHLSIVTEDELDPTLDRPRRPTTNARDLLTAILRRDTDTSATEALRDEQDTEWAIPTLAARYEHLCDELALPRLQALIETAIDQPDAHHILTADAWPALRAQLHRLEHHGHDLPTIIRDAHHTRTLDDARDPAAVLHHRIELHLGADAQPGTYPGLSPAPTEPGPTADYARELHAHLTTQLNHAVPVHLDQPWAHSLRRDHIPDHLLSTIATWRALHGIDDPDRPFGADPEPGRQPPDHRTWLTQQLRDTHQAVADHRTTLLDRLRSADPPPWTAWLGDPPATEEERRRWYHAVTDIALWRQDHDLTHNHLPWSNIPKPPPELTDAINQARRAAAYNADARTRLAFAATSLDSAHHRRQGNAVHDNTRTTDTLHT